MNAANRRPLPPGGCLAGGICISRTADARTGRRARGAERPVVPPGVEEFFLPAEGAVAPLHYAPGILGVARVSFSDRALGVDTTKEVLFLAPVSDDAIQVDWARARKLDLTPADLMRQPEDDSADFAPLGAAGQAKKYSAWQKAFARWLAQNERIELLRHPSLGVAAKAGESERDFRIRLQHEGARGA